MVLYRNKVQTLADAREAVTFESAGQWDQTVSLDAIEAVDASTLKIAGTVHPLTDRATAMIAQRLGIPCNYLRRCPRELQRENMAHWLAVEREERETLFFRHKGDSDATVRAVFTERYKPLDNKTIIGQLYDIGHKDNTRVKCVMDGDWMNIQVLTDNLSIGNDDQYNAGVSIQNSETGLTSLGLAPYILRIICTNGMIGWGPGERSNYRHVNEDLLQGFDREFWAASKNVSLTAEGVEKAKERTLHNADKLMENLSKTFVHGKVERLAINEAWMIEQGDTVNHLVNAYTRAANDSRLTAELSNKLQRNASQVLRMAFKN